MTDIRAQALYQESEKGNVALLTEFGQQAYVEDIESASIIYSRLEAQLAEEMMYLEQAVVAQGAKEEKVEKELRILEHDLMSYVRNNEKTLSQLKIMEARAKRLYEGLKAAGKSTPQLDKLADQLLT